MSPWRIEVLTSLYPSPPAPFEGVFAERRWTRMARRGHDVRVTLPVPLAPGPLAFGRWGELRRMPARELRDGLPVERPRYFHAPGFLLPKPVVRARANARRFARTGSRRILSRGRPDLVVMDYAWPAAMAVPIFHAAGIPCLVNGRGSDVLQVRESPELREDLSKALALAGSWCAVSLDLVAAMDELGGVAGRGVLVANGVDTELFRPRDRSAARTDLGFPPDVAVVAVVGHLIERKDPLLALEVFARGAPRDARCVFIGRGPLEAELRARVASLGLQDRVLLMGELSPERLSLAYGAADLLLLTSRREGRPNVVLEALACGRPVLATPSGGTGELFSGLDERMLSGSRDSDELSSRLKALLERPPAEEALCAAAAAHSWDRSLEALESCIAEALERRTP